MKRIGLFGGTFNPIHRGHTALAQWLIDSGHFDEVWLSLSPANPLKHDRPGATDADRIAMLRLACEGLRGVRACTVEFDMERPSFTIATLRRLAADHPDCSFRAVIGTDNWLQFDRWREPQAIIREFGVTVYPRPGYPDPPAEPDGMEFLADAPRIDISSSAIRADIDAAADRLLPKVANYIKANHLYESKR